MPVMYFRVQWPDRSEDDCYSPSSVVKQFFTPGESYALADFLARARTALNLASERVRAKYGYACSSALDQLAQIEASARRYRAQPGAMVKVIEFTE